MAVEIACGNCGNAFGVQPEWAGMAVECPFCQVALQVPEEIATAGQSEQANQNAVESAPSSTTEQQPSESMAISIDTGREKRTAVDVPVVDLKTKGKTEPNAPKDAKKTANPESKTVKKRKSRWKTRPNNGDANEPTHTPPKSEAAPPQKQPAQADPSQTSKPQNHRQSPKTNSAKTEPAKKTQTSGTAKSSAAGSGKPTDVSSKQPLAAGKSSKSQLAKKTSKPARKSSAKSEVDSESALNSESALPRKTTSGKSQSTSKPGAAEPDTPVPDALVPNKNEPVAQEHVAQEHVAQEEGVTEISEGTASTEAAVVASEDVPHGQPQPEGTVGESSATVQHLPVEFEEYPLAFPPTIWHSQNLATQVDVVVRTGLKEIEYHGEKVLIRDNQSTRNVYQIAGFVISLVILIVVLTWITFR